jgi:hypothetical protein
MRMRAATVTQAQVVYIVERLLGIRRRFRRLVARIQSGQPPRERVRQSRPVQPQPEAEFPLGFRPPPPGWRRWAVKEDKPVPAWRSLRQDTFAWLCAVAPAVPGFRDSAAAHGEQLRRVLAEPETQALLLASRRVGDVLRPLCWMLGIETALLYPARSPASAAVSSPYPLVPAAGSAVATAASAAATAVTVATPRPITPGATNPPPAWPRAREGADFFATD